MTHNIKDMTDGDLLEILLSPFTPAEYKVAALAERTKRAQPSSISQAHPSYAKGMAAGEEALADGADLSTAITSFDQDPPDSDFQRGFLFALNQIQRRVSQ